MSNASESLEVVPVEGPETEITRLNQQIIDLTAAAKEQQTRAIQIEAKLDAANATIAKLADVIEGRGDTNILTVGILRNWSWDKRHSFCLHLLGSEWLRLTIESAKRDALRDALDHIQKQHRIHTTTHCCDVIRALMARERV
jgi:hypothetical protein